MVLQVLCGDPQGNDADEKEEAVTRIYIAGPYTKGDVAVNVRNALRVADYITTRDSRFAVFVPHLAHFWHMVFPRPYEFWLAQDMEWLKASDAVVRIEGESSGADKEVEAAVEWLMPVFTFRGFELSHLNAFDEWLGRLAEGERA